MPCCQHVRVHTPAITRQPLADSSHSAISRTLIALLDRCLKFKREIARQSAGSRSGAPGGPKSV